MVRDRDGGHFVFGGSLSQSVVVAGAVQQTEPGMQMQMNEIRHVLT
jgi:hypothetical protein